MKNVAKRVIPVALAVGASLALFSPVAQADTSTTEGVIPCGLYTPGDGIWYYGNCASSNTLISVTDSGVVTWTQCAPAQSAVTLGVGNYRVTDLHQAC